MTSSVTLLSSSVKPQTDCGNGWHRYRTGCIRFFTQSKERVKANSHCKLFETSNGKRGCMIKIPSIEDNDKVVSLAPQNGRYYIGLTDQDQEGVYRWKGTTDDATYFNWQLGYPHAINIEENRDCTVISTHPDNSYGKWSTVPCSNSWFYICECESACS
ncbi:perlucin-like protein [Stylophora pistillata]|uniref:perlucin-like protein n=1 Tax=Stylophora pistillata TaxID=50429 RepID=UPI000C0558E5|nr:perlucin-like protein [Stylophora pistillata]